MANTTNAPLQVAIIGAGFGGLGMGYYLKQAGIENFTIFEKADEVGGTWRENTYPGSGCDIPSHLYSYSFEPHYPWAYRYGKQAEILEYQRHVARKYGLGRHIRFNAEISATEFDEASGLWTLQLPGGERIQARQVVSAVGQLHRPAYPKLPGLERFKGKAFHSARWDHGFDLKGKSVAVIGTGASAVQFVPEIAKQVQKLHVFQRTPGWFVPKFEKAFGPFTQWLLKTFPILHDIDRWRIFFVAETLAYAYNGNKWVEKLVTLLARTHLRIQVRDPQLRARLTPDFPVGCKRILLSNDWLPTMVRPNVEVVADAIREVTEDGVITADGKLRKVDALIYGTGFTATDFLAPMQVRGLGGQDLRQTWRDGAEAYLGMSVAGFPNFFMLYGPNTNVGSGSIIHMLECQQRYIAQMAQAQLRQGWRYADLRTEAQVAYREEIQLRSSQTTYAGNCQSWYKTAEGRNTNNWVGSMLEFRRRTAQPDFAAYRTATQEPAASLSRAA
ncbi:NAD(P)/FAD-dependent oxidoreductase [Solimonas sp. K1W22B-7]|uniref:flavin-containing monooxygenase n=1 Tax=Solimonas sp. K1W22B-7 TaxID=2303331 RepID=UPI000E332838|nr:NAD(P)/FAD-dependent oxidoreductase [Solimonas sp. K1W22B-7]AXQ31311.1 NAD(P)/FAD-dependent oxidoreductase [Solimonas sp. K1W22B-7]